jgi:hypothetical protein
MPQNGRMYEPLEWLQFQSRTKYFTLNYSPYSHLILYKGDVSIMTCQLHPHVLQEKYERHFQFCYNNY